MKKITIWIPSIIGLVFEAFVTYYLIGIFLHLWQETDYAINITTAFLAFMAFCWLLIIAFLAYGFIFTALDAIKEKSL